MKITPVPEKKDVSSLATVSRPHAQLYITDIVRIGYSIYVRIENKGPDELANNKISIYAGFWNPVKSEGKPHVKKVIWVQNSLPMWVYLGRSIDDDYFSLCSPEKQQCEPDWGLEVHVGSVPSLKLYPEQGPLDYSFYDQGSMPRLFMIENIPIMK